MCRQVALHSTAYIVLLLQAWCCHEPVWLAARQRDVPSLRSELLSMGYCQYGHVELPEPSVTADST